MSLKEKLKKYAKKSGKPLSVLIAKILWDFVENAEINDLPHP
jgi:hypothetical protein